MAAKGTVRLMPALRMGLFTPPTGTFRLQGTTDLLDWVDVAEPVRGVCRSGSLPIEVPEGACFFRWARP